MNDTSHKWMDEQWHSIYIFYCSVWWTFLLRLPGTFLSHPPSTHPTQARLDCALFSSFSFSPPYAVKNNSFGALNNLPLFTTALKALSLIHYNSPGAHCDPARLHLSFWAVLLSHFDVFCQSPPLPTPLSLFLPPLSLLLSGGRW